ncbi:MAG: M48 family metallopeptidase [Neisseria sp.]|nr:M48 family metallopeptidase [Neisseria sp.]
MKKKGITLLTSALIVLGGCTAVADLAGYDSATLNQAAAKNYTQVVSQAKSSRVVDTTSDTARRIQAVFRRMRPFAEAANRTGQPFNWEMTVIRSKELNAWAMPGGKMAFYTGMVETLNLSDAEIAAVVGHEMTHALLEHSKKAAGQQILTGLATQIGGQVLQAKTGVSADTVNLGANILSEYGIGKPFSRSQESEADAGGLRLMAQAGYNPEAAVSLWEKMNKIQDNNTLANSILSTHPTNNTRIADLKRLLPEVMPIYEQSRKAQTSGTAAASRRRR